MRRGLLESRWHMDHNLIMNHEQEKLFIDKTGATKIEGRTLCARLGLCVCKRPDVLLFCKLLFQSMKALFKKVNKVPSEERSLLESGHVVIYFHSDEVDPVFFHIGFVNFTTWHFSGIQLYVDAYDDSTKTVTLTAGDRHHEADSPNQWVNDVATIFEFVLPNMDLRCYWKALYCKILSDNEVVPADEMLARFVDVRVFQDMDSWLWESWDIESQKAKGSKSASKPQPQGENIPPLQWRMPPSQRDTVAEGCSRAKKRARKSVDTDSERIPPHDASDLQDLLETYLEELDSADATHERNDVDNETDVILQLLQEADELEKPEGAAAAASSGSQPDDVPQVPADFFSVEPVPDAVVEHQELVAEPVVASTDDDGRVKSRVARTHEETLVIPGVGEIRHNARLSFLRAHCPQHGLECRRQRQTTAGRRRGQGRPLGALICWLQEAGNHPTQAEHVASVTAGFAQRQAARQFLKTVPGSERFFTYERDATASDLGDGEEPEVIH